MDVNARYRERNRVDIRSTDNHRNRFKNAIIMAQTKSLFDIRMSFIDLKTKFFKGYHRNMDFFGENVRGAAAVGFLLREARLDFVDTSENSTPELEGMIKEVFGYVFMLMLDRFMQLSPEQKHDQMDLVQRAPKRKVRITGLLVTNLIAQALHPGTVLEFQSFPSTKIPYSLRLFSGETVVLHTLLPQNMDSEAEDNLEDAAGVLENDEYKLQDGVIGDASMPIFISSDDEAIS
ncbi:hypothetical protein BJV82DRAFT_384080 [Fennellomyces sp. T-0311]|nr:hypothetical protein BJV82DRAFT_384080 [Fennellomyces sp. T-0311]